MKFPEISMSTMSDHNYSDSEIKSLKMKGVILLSLGILFLFFFVSTIGGSIVSSIFIFCVVSTSIIWGMMILGDQKLPDFLWPIPASEKDILKKETYQLFPDGRRLSDIDIDDLDTERPIHEILSS